RKERDPDPGLINLADAGGRSLLHKACYYSHPDVVKLLVGRGADLTKQDTDGNTPLHSACLRRPDGPKFNDPLDKQALDRAKEKAEKEAQAQITQHLLESGADPNIRDKTKKTPLHLAAFNGNADSTRNLLLRGAESNMKDDRGWTARDVAMVSTKVDAEKVFYDFVGRQQVDAAGERRGHGHH